MDSSKNTKQELREQIEKIFSSDCAALKEDIRVLESRIHRCSSRVNEIEEHLLDEIDPRRRGKLEKDLEQLKIFRDRYKHEKTALCQQLVELHYDHIEREKKHLERIKQTQDNAPTSRNGHGLARRAEQLIKHIDEHEKDLAVFEEKLDLFSEEKDLRNDKPRAKSQQISVARNTQNIDFQTLVRQILSSIGAFLQIRRLKTKELIVTLVVLFFVGLGIKRITYHQCDENRINVCRSALIFAPSNTKTLITTGRSTLLKLDPESDVETQRLIVDKTKEYFDRAVTASKKSEISDKAKALFYQSFMQDFDRFVIQKDFTCTEDNSVESVYKDVLNIYESNSYRVSSDEYFLFLELSHFLMHRDENYERALKLLEQAALAKPDERASDEIKQQYKAVLLTKAKAESYLQQFENAKTSLKAALEYEPRSYKIKRDLASVSAQVSVDGFTSEKVQSSALQDAIRYYEEILAEGIATNDYRARRNLSFLYYLREDRKAIESFRELTNSESFQSENTLRFNSNIALQSDRENIGTLIRKYQGFSENRCFETQGCNGQGSIDSLKIELRNARLFHDYFITHDVIEEEFNDPFFTLEHDKFYKCNKF